ncbi:MAG: Uncharacterised protein [Methanobacteriota archaeon]|nr:MAG: Uncharacterised protein [Euryarchaeota archaeon]
MVLCLMMFCSILSSVISVESETEDLSISPVVKYVDTPNQDYRFYFDGKTQADEQSGDFPQSDGKITTKEPSSGNQASVSIIENTAEFTTPYLLSDINISGVNNEIIFNVFFQFEGPAEASAEMSVKLTTDAGVLISTVNEDLEDPCSTSPFSSQPNCDEDNPDDESLLLENVGTTLVESDGFLKVEIEIVSKNGCDSGGFGTGGCDVKIFFGDINNDNSETYLNVRTNTLSGSSIKVHKEGAGWNDVETIDWYPHDSDEDRNMQISVDIRSAFGRADINEIEVFIDDADGVDGISEFSHIFSNNDLKLDNGGLVGNVIYSYQKGGLKAGTYPIELRVTDLQHNSPVIFSHEPLISHTYGVDFELSDEQGDTLLVAPDQTSRLEFSLTHIGYADNEISVELSIQPPLTNDWQVEFDQPVGGYQLDYGGTNIKPTLLIKAPAEDMSTTPSTINIIAVPKVNGSQVTDVSQILLDVEQIDVFSDPRLSIFEDAEHQIQIGDSVDGDFDVNASNFVDFEGIGEFYLDVRNTGFDVDQFRMKFLEIPDQWDAAFVDNNTGEAIVKDQGAYPTGDVNSNVIETVLIEVYPPIDREAPDLGKITLEVTSANDLTLRATISFTVQRTFGVHSTVIYDCDASPLGYVNAELSTCENPEFNDETFRLKVTSTASESDTQITTFQLKNPSLLDKIILTPDGELVSQKDYYGTWDFEIYDSNSSLASNVKLSSGDSTEIKLLITPSMGMLSGDHTIYLRIIEEVEADSGIEPKYFDMPLTVFIGEDEPQIEITQTSANELIGINSFEEIEMRVYNVANVEALVLLKLESTIGGDWKVEIESEDGGELLTVAPFSEKNFTIRIDSPPCMRHNEVYDFEITAKPLDLNEAYGSEYTTVKTVRIQTNVDNIPCRIQSELFSEPDPITLGVLGSVVLMAVFWFSRRGANGQELDMWDVEESFDESSDIQSSISEEIETNEETIEDIPEPIHYEEVELVEED